MALERWLVRILVDRDPELEATPDEWDWATMLDGGDPHVIAALPVGLVSSEDTDCDVA